MQGVLTLSAPRIRRTLALDVSTTFRTPSVSFIRRSRNKKIVHFTDEENMVYCTFYSQNTTLFDIKIEDALMLPRFVPL